MYIFEGIENLPIKYAISTVADGNMSFVWGEKERVIENRKKFLQKNNFDFNLCVTVRTTDSELIEEVSGKDIGRGMNEIDSTVKADAMVTKNESLTLFLVVADCSPVIFYDSKNKVLALVHLNGKNPNLIEKTVNYLNENFNSITSDLIVSVGPSIQKESFIVDDPFQRHQEDWEGFFKDLPNGRTAIDMVGYLKKRMLNAGIKPKNLFINLIDTFKEENLFSHRRSAETGEIEGRFAVALSLTN